MKLRPVRPNIFKPLPRLGVNTSDWKYVAAGGLLCFILPFILGLWVGHFPLGAITGPLVLAFLIGFFNHVRKGKKPHWTSHRLKAMLTRSARWHRSMPGDYSNNPWLTDEDAG